MALEPTDPKELYDIAEYALQLREREILNELADVREQIEQLPTKSERKEMR